MKKPLLLIAILAAVALMSGLQSLVFAESDELIDPDGSIYITFGSALPAYYNFTYTASCTEELTIALRDCCIRDDVVEVYVDDNLIGIVDSRDGDWGTHPWQYLTVLICPGTHDISFKNVISSVGPSGWYYDLFHECQPVGGFWVPISKTELLAPWITLGSLITVAAVSIVFVKHRKKNHN